MNATTKRDQVEREITRCFSWEASVHDSDRDADHVWLGEQFDPRGNCGEGVGHYGVDELLEILGDLPDYDSLPERTEDGQTCRDTSGQWEAIEPAREYGTSRRHP